MFVGVVCGIRSTLFIIHQPNAFKKVPYVVYFRLIYVKKLPKSAELLKHKHYDVYIFEEIYMSFIDQK